MTLLDFSQRRELSLHSEVAASVTNALTDLGIAGIVVGAFARDLHLHYGAGVPVQRATEDIDFAFAVSSWAEFEALRKRLIKSESFRTVEGKQHRLRHTNDMKIDLVPFGNIESSERTISWPPKGDTVMDVYGFQESLKTAKQVLLPVNVTVSIVSLPAFALLKIVAWEDRHRRYPIKDATDLNLILKNYLAVQENQQRLWNDFNEWTESADFDVEQSAARMLGHDIRSLVNEPGFRKLTGILRAQLDQGGLGQLQQEMNSRAPEHAHALLTALHDGLASSERQQ